MATGCSPERKYVPVSHTQVITQIQLLYGKDEAVTLYADHHLEEIPKDILFQLTGREDPSPDELLQTLEYRSSSHENDEAVFDYSLPSGVTQYVLAVTFSHDGKIEDIEMES